MNFEKLHDSWQAEIACILSMLISFRLPSWQVSNIFCSIVRPQSRRYPPVAIMVGSIGLVALIWLYQSPCSKRSKRGMSDCKHLTSRLIASEVSIGLRSESRHAIEGA
nr:hypothetical protein CFP56_33470 [Quercus suber]